jgi:hypothetical protein
MRVVGALVVAVNTTTTLFTPAIVAVTIVEVVVTITALFAMRVVGALIVARTAGWSVACRWCMGIDFDGVATGDAQQQQ